MAHGFKNIEDYDLLVQCPEALEDLIIHGSDTFGDKYSYIILDFVHCVEEKDQTECASNLEVV